MISRLVILASLPRPGQWLTPVPARGRQGGVRAFTLRSIDLAPSVGNVSQVVTVHKGTEKPIASATKSIVIVDAGVGHIFSKGDLMLAYARLHNKLESIK